MQSSSSKSDAALAASLQQQTQNAVTNGLGNQVASAGGCANQAAAQNGWIDGDRAMMESLMGFKRAGCDGVLTYFAPLAARVLNG